MPFYAILILFFFQLITDFIEAVYAFGLLGTGIPLEIASVLFFFAPVLWLIRAGKSVKRKIQYLTALMLAARLAYPLLDTRGQMLVAGAGVAAFLLLLPALLAEAAQKDDQQTIGNMATGLTLAMVAAIALRTFGSSIDVSTFGWTQVIAWVLAASALWHLPKLEGEVQLQESHPSSGRVTLLCVGLIAALTLLYFAFSAPNVIARWTGNNYLLVVTLLAAALVVFAYLIGRAEFWQRLTPAILWGWNAAFVIALPATILPYQIRFPIDPSYYPLSEPIVGAWASLPLVLMLLLSPIILVDFTLFSQQLYQLRPSLRQLGGGLSLAALFLLLIVFAQVFTTVYDYIPVVGPFFRDKFWLVFLITGLVMALPTLLIRKVVFHTNLTSKNAFIGTLLLGVIAIDGILFTQAHPLPTTEKSSLKIMTYNIQQGYSGDGLKNIENQLALIKEWNVDILSLQESDTNRIAGGNDDVVRYFADHLDMYAYYGPKTIPGTFGIALLSRYPLEQPRTFYMYSQGEQTATIVAQIAVGGRIFNVFVTHLGNGGPIVQQQAILQETKDLQNLIMMGDFNFAPDSDPYRLTRQSFEDAWLLRWPSGSDDQGVNPLDRIDHIFLSTGMKVNEARYIFSPASDHPALVVELGW